MSLKSKVDKLDKALNILKKEVGVYVKKYKIDKELLLFMKNNGYKYDSFYDYSDNGYIVLEFEKVVKLTGLDEKFGFFEFTLTITFGTNEDDSDPFEFYIARSDKKHGRVQEVSTAYLTTDGITETKSIYENLNTLFVAADEWVKKELIFLHELDDGHK